MLKDYFSFLILLSGFLLNGQSWQQLTDFPSFERDDAVSFVIGNKAYCGTGLTPWFAPLADFHAFDMTTESWSTTAPLPNGEERQYASAFSVNGRGYVFGGTGNGLRNDLWQYNPANDSWQPMNNLPDSGRSAAVAFVINGTPYLCGGRTSTHNAINEVWAYDATLDFWNPKNDFPYGGRWRACGAGLNGKGYLLFGQDNNQRYPDSLYEYDPALDRWAAIARFPGPGRTHARMEAINGQLVIFGGKDSSNNYYNDLWRFNPADHSWEELTPTPARGRKGGLSFTNGRDLYYTTGIDSTNTRLKETWKVSRPVIGLHEMARPAFSLYPNPARDFIHIRLTENYHPDAATWALLDWNGRVLKKGNINTRQTQIDVGTLSAGSYLLQFTIRGVVCRQLIVLSK